MCINDRKYFPFMFSLYYGTDKRNAEKKPLNLLLHLVSPINFDTKSAIDNSFASEYAFQVNEWVSK